MSLQQITVAFFQCEGYSRVNLLFRCDLGVWVCLKLHIPATDTFDLLCYYRYGLVLSDRRFELPKQCHVLRRYLCKSPTVFFDVMKLCHEWNFNSGKYSVHHVFHKPLTCQWTKRCSEIRYRLQHVGLENVSPFKSGYFGYLISKLNFTVVSMTCIERSIYISTCGQIVVRLRALGAPLAQFGF